MRGLGAVLYALVTGYWPLGSELAGPIGPSSPAGVDEPARLPAAPRDSRGVVVAPAVLNPAIGWEISELAMAALDADDRGRGSPARGWLRTAAAVVRVAEDIRTNWTVELLPPSDATAPRPGSLWQTDHRDPRPRRVPWADMSRRETTSLVGMGVVTLAVLSYLGIQAAAPLASHATANPTPAATMPAPAHGEPVPADQGAGNQAANRGGDHATRPRGRHHVVASDKPRKSDKPRRPDESDASDDD